MGLLDLPDINTPAGQGLLAASLSLMGAQKMPGQKGAFGSALANAGRTYMDTRNQAGEQMQAQEFKRLQLDALKRKMEQEKQQATEAERVRNLIAGAGMPKLGMGGTSQVNDALPNDLQIGPLAALQVPGQIDYQSLIRQGVPYDMVKNLADSQNLGRPKVARTADIEGPNGSKLVQGFDDYGQPVGQGAPGYVAPQLIDQGDRKTFAKPMIGQSFGVGMSPSERDSSARDWASNSIAKQRLAFDQAGGVDGMGGQGSLIKQFGKAPTGYQWKQDGGLEAIQGGPADIKAGELGAKREKQQAGAINQADRIINKVDQALSKVGYNTAGAGGSVMGWLPGTEATDLGRDLETIKANLGFAELQAMRDASPTGGALGQVAVQELVALQSTIASLDRAQSPSQLKARLGEIKTHYDNWKKTMQPQGGGASGGWEKPAKSGGWSIQKAD